MNSESLPVCHGSFTATRCRCSPARFGSPHSANRTAAQAPGTEPPPARVDTGEHEAGATVHFVTEQPDGGPAIVQARVAINSDDNPDSLAAKILLQKHQIYPVVAQCFADQRLTLENNNALLVYKKIPVNGLAI